MAVSFVVYKWALGILNLVLTRLLGGVDSRDWCGLIYNYGEELDVLDYFEKQNILESKSFFFNFTWALIKRRVKKKK